MKIRKSVRVDRLEFGLVRGRKRGRGCGLGSSCGLGRERRKEGSHGACNGGDCRDDGLGRTGWKIHGRNVREEGRDLRRFGRGRRAAVPDVYGLSGGIGYLAQVVGDLIHHGGREAGGASDDREDSRDGGDDGLQGRDG